MEKILSVKQFSLYQMGYLLYKIPHKLGLRLQLVLPSYRSKYILQGVGVAIKRYGS